MIPWYGYRPASSTIYMPFHSFTAATGASSATSNFVAGDILIYKDGGTTQRTSANGITASTTFDSQTGLNLVAIDLSDNTDAGFYAAGHSYAVAVADVTIDSQTVRFWLGSFDIGPAQVDVRQLLGTAWLTPGTAGTPDVNVKLWNALTTVALPLIPTTAGRTLDVSATGEAGVDWANVGSPTTTLDLSGTTIKTSQVVASVSGAVGSVTGAVGSIATGGIAAASFAAGAIDAAAIADNAIDAGAIAANAITATKIATGAITNAKFAAGAIDAAAIADAAIDAATFAAGAIDAAAIAADAIGASELAADAATEIGTAVWATATRVLTANTNLNDLSAAGVRTAVGLASANLDTQFTACKGTTQITESYAANGVAPTRDQAMMAIHQMLMQFGIASTSLTVKKLDNSSTAFIVTLDSATAPTAAVRT